MNAIVRLGAAVVVTAILMLGAAIIAVVETPEPTTMLTEPG